MESLGDPHTSRQLDVVIRPAQVADLPYVLALATERSLDRAGADPPSTGFLVSGYTLAEYEELLDRAEYFYVATRGGGVVGFVLAYGRDRVGSGEWLNLRMAERFADFVVIKQVCVAAGCAGKGIASKLYERVIERIGERVLLAAVVAEPPNRPSKALHQKVGFIPLVSLTPPDGLPRIVWVRLPRDTRALEAQLSRALDLYKHEDLLNWQKLNNFFYITTALIAVCGLTISVNGKVWTVIVSATAGLGLVVSIAFLVTLRAGTHYLQARKQSITQFEQVLFAHPAKIQPSPESDRKRDRVLLRSPSILVLQAIPLVGLLGWAVLLVYALARGA